MNMVCFMYGVTMLRAKPMNTFTFSLSICIHRVIRKLPQLVNIHLHVFMYSFTINGAVSVYDYIMMSNS